MVLMITSVKLENIRVMVIDDHDPIRKAIKRILQSLGFKNVIECFDGTDAIQELARQNVDLVLCDLYMRKVDGFKVLSQIRNRSIASDIPVIIVTGEASKEDIVKASDLGATDYILKPFQAESFEQKIKLALTNFFSPTPLLKAIRLGDRYALGRDFPKSQGAYEEACKIDPTSMRAKHSLAVTHELLGNLDHAILLLKKNINESHSYYKNFGTLADIYLKQKKVTKAAAAMKRELELNPKQPDRQVLLAKLLFKQSDFVGAIEHYREALKENQKLKSALLGMGHSFAKLNDLEKSIYYFRRLRRHHPADDQGLKAAVKYCLRANEAKKAEAMLRDEKRSHPERLDTYVLLVSLFLHLKEYPKALEVLDELFKIDPSNREGLIIRADILMKQKNYMAAFKTYQDILSKTPSTEVYILVADCLRLMEKPLESNKALINALVLSPKSPQAYLGIAENFGKSDQLLKGLIMALQAKKQGAEEEIVLKLVQDLAVRLKARRTEPTPHHHPPHNYKTSA